jgi:hypothetical protein
MIENSYKKLVFNITAKPKEVKRISRSGCVNYKQTIVIAAAKRRLGCKDNEFFNQANMR